MVLYRRTLLALLAPRRLAPIALVALPLLYAQSQFSSSGYALRVGVGMVVTFVAIAPFAWRALFPRDRRVEWAPLRLLGYFALGAVPTVLGGLALPWLWGVQNTFLTDPKTLGVTAALFWVGGWGLARDIDLEEALAAETARAEALAREAERAQLLAIRAHLDPHFLFNTLNAIAEYCRIDGETAEKAVLELSRVLRRVLAGVKASEWPLAEELAIVRGVLDLHHLRDPSRFSIDWRAAEVPPVAVPPLVLLPLVENAVKHGPAEGHPGVVTVEVRAEGPDLVLTITNPGAYAGPRDGGEGLPMVRRRLALAYGDAARLDVRAAGQTTVATVRVPRAGPSSEVPT